MSKGSPARKVPGHVPTKVTTQAKKPIEKPLKTPTSASIPTAKKVTPKRESQPVNKAPSPAEQKDEPVAEKAPVEEKPAETKSVESVEASEAIEKSADFASEGTKEAPQVNEEQPAASDETKSEQTTPEAIQKDVEVEEPVAEANASAEITEQKPSSPLVTEPEVAEVPGVKEEPEPLAEDREPALDTHTDSDQKDIDSGEVEAVPVTEDHSEDQAAKTSSPTATSTEKRSTEAVEDPEDAKARAEVERLNAEFAKLAVEPETTTS
jgi:hypothetical protein